MSLDGLAIELGDLPLSEVHLMPDLLQWEESSQAGFDAVFDGYVAFVSQMLGYAIGECERQNSALAGRLAAKLETVPARDFLRVILAPEFTNRLLWQHPDRIQRACEFLDQSLHVEGVINGREEAHCDAWTALGDRRVLSSGEVLSGVEIAGLPPVDFDSPNVTIDVRSGEFAPDMFQSLSNDVRPVVIDRMSTAWHEISATSKVVADFVAKFVQIIVLQNDSARMKFSSVSTGSHIGLVVIRNPHSDDASEIALAEVMIHEAIHALLFMALHTSPWGANRDRAYTKGVRIESPWSGRPLDLYQFLQACFVWYGLLNFWKLADQSKSFKGTDKARRSMAHALKGFVGSPLLDELCSADRKAVRDDVSNAIETMQSRVKACFR